MIPNKTKRLVILCGSRRGLYLATGGSANNKNPYSRPYFSFKVILLLLLFIRWYFYIHIFRRIWFFVCAIVIVITIAIWSDCIRWCHRHHHLSLHFFARYGEQIIFSSALFTKHWTQLSKKRWKTCTNNSWMSLISFYFQRKWNEFITFFQTTFHSIGMGFGFALFASTKIFDRMIFGQYCLRNERICEWSEISLSNYQRWNIWVCIESARV